MKNAKLTVVQSRNLYELESDFYDVTHMALIASDLVDHALGDRGCQMEVTGRPDTYFIGEEEADAMIYACNEVHIMIRRLRDRYLDRK